MPDKLDVAELELSDAELVEVLKNHGMDRRTLMKAFGVGAGVAALGGTAAGKKPGGASIDEVYGAPYEASESVPSGIVDQLVELHIHHGVGDHPGFPMIDLPEDGDSDPDIEGPEFFFDPVGIHLRKNGVIHFNVHNGLHTVTALHSKFDEPGVFDFPDRVPTEHAFTSPVMNNGDSWLYRFVTPGIYDIMCLPHYGFGMVVRVVVTGPNDSVPEDTYDNSSLSGPVKAVFGAEEMEPSNIVSEGTVAWEDLTL